MLKKAKIYALLSIIVASTAVGLFSFPQSASAQTTDTGSSGSEWEDKRILDYVTAQTYVHIMAHCLYRSQNTNSGGGAIAAKDIADGKWFDNNTSANNKKADENIIGVGVEVSGFDDDGKLSCVDENKDNIVSTFLSIFGWSSNTTAICDLGFKDAEALGIQSGDCATTLSKGMPVASLNTSEDTFYNAIIQKAPKKDNLNNAASTANNDAITYLLAKRAYENACGAKSIGTNPSTDELASANGAKQIKVVTWDVNSNKGSTELVYYTPPSNATKKIVLQYENGQQSVTCSDIFNLLQGGQADAYLAWLTQNPPSASDQASGTATGTGSGDGNAASTCQITGIGWMVCPVMNFLAGVADGAYYALDRLFLRLPPVNLDTSSEENGTYRAWSIMRDLANIVFVIAFLIIVFSQVTNIGISNYGLKRLVPKLVMAAILVNVSYILCAIAVDLSNIMGSSLKDLLDSVRVIPEGSVTDYNSGAGWAGTTEKILAYSVVGGAALFGWSVLGLLGVALLAIVPVVLTVLVTMLIRQAAVVLLIVVSPLAFVALLLPNTEGYYKKWLGLFKTMLLMYPVVAILFGAAGLASDVLMVAAKDAGNDGAQMLNGIVAGIVQILPLVLIPTVIKISEGIFGKVTGFINDNQKGWFDSKRNEQMERVKHSQAENAVRRANDPNRVRAFDRFSTLGSITRQKRRKDRISETESLGERAYLSTEQGVAARNTLKNSQLELHDAELHAETIRLSSAEGVHIQQQTMTAEARKQIAEDTNKEIARGMVPMELKTQQATSAQNLANAENRDKQAYAELAAAGSSDPRLLATHGVSAASADAAQAAGSETKAIDNALSTAKSEAETNFSNATGGGDPALVDAALVGRASGNVNPAKGRSRVRARAVATASSDEAEAIENEVKTMSRAPIPDLQAIAENRSGTETIERQIGARVAIVRRGSDEDIIQTLNQVGSAGTIDPTTGRQTDNNVITMQQYVFPEIEKRSQMIMGAQEMANGKAGQFHPNLSASRRATVSRFHGTDTDSASDALARGRLTSGKLTPLDIAKKPAAQIEHLVDVLENGADQATLVLEPNVTQLGEDMRDYLARIPTLPEQERPTPQVLNLLRRIGTVIPP